MAQMIRAPAAAPVDAPDTDLPRGSEAEKKALRERIEAKRRDDMVRKRELGQLRKLMKKKGSEGRFPRCFRPVRAFAPKTCCCGRAPAHCKRLTP
jgi:hypothetical protein